MVKFKDLFSFSRREVDAAFKVVRPAGRTHGLKLLCASLKDCDRSIFTQDHGRLLIIIPRRVGKAHDRNVLRRRIKALFYENKLYERERICILLVYPDAKKLSFDELTAFLTSKI